MSQVSPGELRRILGHLGNDLVNVSKRNIAEERNYDGTPMRSPATERKFGDRFAKSYNWRYRPGYMLASARRAKGRRDIISASTVDKRGRAKERLRVRRRKAVTESSKQLQDTGATIKSIDMLSLSSHKAVVGPKTGHGQKILEVHELRKKGPTRYPLGISQEWADKAALYASSELGKGAK
jgi:hypothetical protein